jgi:hypothetical protein
MDQETVRLLISVGGALGVAGITAGVTFMVAAGKREHETDTAREIRDVQKLEQMYQALVKANQATNALQTYLTTSIAFDKSLVKDLQPPELHECEMLAGLYAPLLLPDIERITMEFTALLNIVVKGAMANARKELSDDGKANAIVDCVRKARQVEEYVKAAQRKVASHMIPYRSQPKRKAKFWRFAWPVLYRRKAAATG